MISVPVNPLHFKLLSLAARISSQSLSQYFLAVVFPCYLDTFKNEYSCDLAHGFTILSQQTSKELVYTTKKLAEGQTYMDLELDNRSESIIAGSDTFHKGRFELWVKNYLEHFAASHGF